MLDPYDRHLLLESLRPPDGYTLDHAIGTTFSLDLTALLAAPLAFTLFDWEEENGKPAADPLALLAALRENAERITIFCQAGQIGVPPPHQLLFSHLEDAVVEARAPLGGVFHPKIWVLRYLPDDEDEPVAYRLVCLTRNLTFDQSWDAIVVLDGELTDRQRAFASNGPLAKFVQALPTLATSELPAGRQATIDRVAAELPRVRFEPPEGFDSVGFWGSGTNAQDPEWPFLDDIRRFLVVSPFLSARALADLAGPDNGTDTLISRAETLDAMARDDLRAFREIYVLDEAATPPSDDGQPVEAAETQESDPSVEQTLRGLHAKIYVGDRGRDADVWIGSANATTAAFERNVEFLVQLSGKKSKCGVDAILDLESKDGLPSLLVPYTPRDEPLVADPTRERLEKRAEEIRRRIAEASMELVVRNTSSGDGYELELQGDLSNVPPDGSIRAWPATLKEAGFQRPIEATTGSLATFAPVPLTHLSPFVAYSVRLEAEGQQLEVRFTAKVPLVDAPSGRREAILGMLLENRRGLLRFLLLLLAGSRADALMAAAASRFLHGQDGDRGAGGGFELPLLEVLLQALDRSPEKLQAVQRLIDELTRTEHGASVLGEDLPAVWDPIWAAYEEARRA